MFLGRTPRRFPRDRHTSPPQLRRHLSQFQVTRTPSSGGSRMKLARITKPLRSVRARVMLAGNPDAGLERYALYYEYVHGDPVEGSSLIPEILRAFLDADREFQLWS